VPERTRRDLEIVEVGAAAAFEGVFAERAEVIDGHLLVVAATGSAVSWKYQHSNRCSFG
jgi:hypothetical protein